MFEYIKGNVVEINPAYAVIDVGGMGYVVNVSLYTYAKLEGLKNVLLFIHQVIRDDAHLLYGFITKSERELFRQLISVSGVGPNTARLILSSLSAEEISQAIMQGDVNTLKQVKGIGLKTAQRIVVDLKDKVGKSLDDQDIFAPLNNTLKQEALSALVMLGFTKSVAEKSIDKLLKKNPSYSVESLIKDALKGL
ncbi:MAG TPA: Holliday junction branch migration protein RuvA [Perlabentimonas sp.]|jgi:Holliday junction DNA helicase RuvA|nr:Holliday junction branch migration protein RuvA [Bacteroidales bacterium]MDD4671589.1 Holliday junction branch migration protein RuvA [Bacteroidales bacterium]MDY0347672.1 Holliday junction branch migration protein RuvA [Tenuifilaceae bacterium]HZJ74890.1 Holliday junction branch migration protein RuvA [Perlabentimonas sp.]